MPLIFSPSYAHFWGHIRSCKISGSFYGRNILILWLIPGYGLSLRPFKVMVSTYGNRLKDG
jgi:hypothetical protein